MRIAWRRVFSRVHGLMDIVAFWYPEENREKANQQFDDRQIPDFREYTTGELIAVTAQRLGILMNVSRQEQDEFALRSHMLAAAAYERGYINDVMPIRRK